MEKNKKELKILSILILALTALTVVLSVLDLCIKGLPQVEAPEGFTQEAVQVVAIISVVITYVVLIPQIYVGFKGLKIATSTEQVAGKAHMVWAVILAVVVGISTISGISGLFSAFDVSKLLNVFTHAVDVFIYVYYFIIARRVANGN